MPSTNKNRKERKKEKKRGEYTLLNNNIYIYTLLHHHRLISFWHCLSPRDGGDMEPKEEEEDEFNFGTLILLRLEFLECL